MSSFDINPPEGTRRIIKTGLDRMASGVRELRKLTAEEVWNLDAIRAIVVEIGSGADIYIGELNNLSKMLMLVDHLRQNGFTITGPDGDSGPSMEGSDSDPFNDNDYIMNLLRRKGKL